MEDQKIVTMLFRRVESVLDALARKYGPRLYRIAMNILGQPQDAEEAVNDTYLAVWNTVPPNKPDPLSGYIYKTGRNISLDKMKYNHAQQRDNRYTLSIDELENFLPGTCLEEQVQAKELGRAINRFLGKISPDNRALFLRRYWFGDEVRDIARDLGLSANAASVRLNRIRKQLREHLIKEGYTDG